VASVGGASGGAWCGHKERGRGVAARRHGAERDRPVLVLLSIGLNTNNSKILNRSAQNFEYESVDLTTPTTFTKAIWGFSPQNWQKKLANIECHLVLVNRRYCQWTKFFTFSPSKFEMPIYMKVVSLNKLDNFHKGRFLSFRVNFGERGKSSGR
jgi:hypothetical protein